MENTDDFWIRLAIDLAKESRTPYGAVIVDSSGQYVSGYNTTIHDGATAHAEMNALKKMPNLDYDQEEELILYSTVEPCPMCMSAIIWAGIGKVVYGCNIDYAMQFGNQIDIKSELIASEAWYAIEIVKGVEEEKCKELFQTT